MADNIDIKSISILHVVLSTETGGMENIIYNLASGVNRNRFNIKILCLDKIGPLSKKLSDIGIESKLAGRMMPGFSMLYPAQLIKIIKQSGCQIIHSHSGCWFKVAIACSHVPDISHIYTEHGRTFPDKKLKILMDKYSMRWTDKVVAVGAILQRYLSETVCLPSKKIININNCIDTDRFQPIGKRADIRNELGYTEDEIVIANVARLAPVKNHGLLIDVFKQINRDYPQARLMIIGDGPLRDDLEQQTSLFGLSDKIKFLGDRDDVPRILPAADISTLSSLSEGISLTILEAMSCGLPVVATSVGGNPSIITNGENGYLINSGDRDNYVISLAKLIDSQELRTDMGLKARQNIIDNWSLKLMVSKYEELYEELIREP
ncbi:MAG: glycosyltransferase [Candidatus Zixiibacteriota bacterium]